MVRSSTNLTILVTALVCFGAVVAHAAPTRIFLTEYQYMNPKIKAMNLDGTNPHELFAPPPAEWLPVGCDYDAASGKIYWTHGGSPGTIRRANLDGGGLQLLVSGLKYPRGISVDAVHGKMYWVESPPAGNATGLLKRASLDGTLIETVYAENPYDPNLSYVGRPTVDPVNGYVYFCAGGEIRRVALEGSGPIETVVRGVTTVAAIALDVADDRIYFADANTNSDYIGRANLDDTDFTVLYDNSPGFTGTSGFFDMKADLEGGMIYWTDELAQTVRRVSLDGLGMVTLYTSPSALAPTGLAFDTKPPQAMMDCNNNGTRDLDDIRSGSSLDCNTNGIPDECEFNPCVPISYAINYGSDPSGHRTVSGDPAAGFEVFQAFDLAAQTFVTEIDLDGWTTTYQSAGFIATIFPDDGTGGFPNEGAPVTSVAFQYRFSGTTIAWVSRPIHADLAAGRWWVRLTAANTIYAGAASYGTSGPTSLSRRLSNGQIVHASRSIALRLRGLDPASVDEGADLAGVRLSLPAPNPARESTTLRFETTDPAWVACSIVDAAGRIVKRWEGSLLGPGPHEYRWDGRGSDGLPVSSGVYFTRIEVRGAEKWATQVRSMPVLMIR